MENGNFMDYTTVTTTQPQTASTAAVGGILLFIGILSIAITLILTVSLWKIFSKANEAGWKAIIPIYNIVVLLKIIGRPWWWILVLPIPVLGLVLQVIVGLDLAKSFGKSEVFGIFGLCLFIYIGFPILGFGSAKYVGPSGKSSAPTAPAATAA